jgi:hypothetical protein
MRTLPIADSAIFVSPEETWHGWIQVDNCVLTCLTSRGVTVSAYHFVRRPAIATLRGVAALVGVFFAFSSLLGFTPAWTALIYMAGLLPEILGTLIFVDVVALRKLVVEFEFIVIVLSLAVFAGLLADALQDFRAAVPIVIFVVVASSQCADVSLPYQSSSSTDTAYALAGALACLALYIITQFGFVNDLTQRTLVFQVSLTKVVTFSNVQFACDRLLTAVFFLAKQSFSIYYRPGTFVTIKASIRKNVDEVQ